MSQDIEEVLRDHAEGRASEDDVFAALFDAINTLGVDGVLRSLPRDWCDRFLDWAWNSYDTDTPPDEYVTLHVAEIDPRTVSAILSLRAWFREHKPSDPIPLAVDDGQLRRIGMFRESGHGEMPDAPSLRRLRGRRVHKHAVEVARYLRAGHVLAFSPGIVVDYFDRTGNVIAGTPTLRTDGVFVWPDFLAHYVEKHQVSLPRAFEWHMEASGWMVPASVRVKTF